MVIRIFRTNDSPKAYQTVSRIAILAHKNNGVVRMSANCSSEFLLIFSCKNQYDKCLDDLKSYSIQEKFQLTGVFYNVQS